MSIRDLDAFFEGLQLSVVEHRIADVILKEIRARLNFLKDVGLAYLNLARSAGTLSGGESQRIRLATQIGSGLTASCIFWMNRVSASIKGIMKSC